MKYTSPSFRKTTLQHDTATPMPHGWDGVLWVTSLTLLLPCKMFIFVLSDHRTFLQCSSANFRLAFSIPRFEVVVSSLGNSLLGYDDTAFSLLWN